MRKAFVLVVSALVVASLIVPPAVSGGALMLVRVVVEDASQAGFLASHFDETHNHRDGHIELLLWPGDRERLERAGFTDYEIVSADVIGEASRALAEGGPRVALPGPDRDTYRTLEDYNSEMRALADKHPDLVRLIKLPHQSLEGRRVLGVEIAANVGDQGDGRPYFHVDGIHHAREWPAGEYPMIFAHYLVERFGKDKRITSLLRRVRVEIVPVVNVDGFDYARDSLVDPQGAGSFPLSLLGLEAYWRKNRRSFTGITAPVTEHNPDAYGVDPNRNYGFFWGDNQGGSSGERTSQTYRGEEPFSEPEARNIRELVLSRQVTGLITNHTSGRLVLRPWGHTAEDAPDEGRLRRLGDAMAEAMGGYTSQKGIGLYATTGTTDDWSYAATGGLGYTFEHETAFHPPYAQSVGANFKGVMEAFVLGAEAAADPANHAVVTGRMVSPDGDPIEGKVRLSKEFETPLWEGNPTGKDAIRERLTSEFKTGPDGSFELHLNPSTRPMPAAEGEREFFRLGFIGGGRTSSAKVYLKRGDRLDLGDIVLDQTVARIFIIEEIGTGTFRIPPV